MPASLSEMPTYRRRCSAAPANTGSRPIFRHLQLGHQARVSSSNAVHSVSDRENSGQRQHLRREFVSLMADHGIPVRPMTGGIASITSPLLVFECASFKEFMRGVAGALCPVAISHVMPNLSAFASADTFPLILLATSGICAHYRDSGSIVFLPYAQQHELHRYVV